MSDTSATGGYLIPASSPAPLEDTALDVFLQSMVVGITGLAGSLVRPRWQPVPPQQPPVTTDWCAIGVTDAEPDTFAAFHHNPAGSGSDEFRRHEVLTVVASFYGPDARNYAGMLRDGLQVPQNLEPLYLAAMGLVDVTGPTNLTEYVNAQWLQRRDIRIRIKREIQRTYPVLNLVSAEGEIIDDSPNLTQSWSVTSGS